MRLTVHHSAELLPYWLDSLNKLLATDGLNRDKLLNAGHWHVATFNDRVVGLAVTKDEELIYFAVRDATRRRGVGQYLLTETLNWMRTEGFGPISAFAVIGSAVTAKIMQNSSMKSPTYIPFFIPGTSFQSLDS